MRYVARVLLGLAGAIGALVLVLAGLLWISAHRALPQTEGKLTVAGLGAQVTVARDGHGIPLITAANDGDAYFALGYVHAQERLFQMELVRRQGQGRLSELIGRLGLSADRQMRTLGIYRLAERDVGSLDENTRSAIDRYAAGVNAWLGEKHPLPFEFHVLQVRPEPWKPADSLVWQKLMGLQLSGNWNQELLNASLIAKLGPERAAALSPGPKPEHPVTVTRHAALYEALAPARLLAEMTAVIRPTMASNQWVIAGTRTESGKPLLANDPHLGFQAPTLWYFAAIDTPTLKIFGVTLPGLPFHLLGHTDRLAWGFTTPESDTADLFIERVQGDNYETPDGPKPFVSRTETINVRFGSPVTLTVRESRHGPIVSDILRTKDAPKEIVGEGHLLALSAALLHPGDRTADAMYRVNRARTVPEFIEALKLYGAPQQNMTFADTEGGIGYYLPGRLPVRKAGDGQVPVPGWTGEFDWTGWLPFEELPHDINPPAGLLINANQKMVGDDYPHLIAARWPDSYRAARIEKLMSPMAAATVESVARVQMDTLSMMTQELLPPLLAHFTPESDRDRAFVEKLKAWDGDANRDRFEPLLFALWMEKTKTAILADELGELFAQFGGLRPELMLRIFENDLGWCDDTRTPDTETCANQVALGWREALSWLAAHGVSDPANAQWGRFHVATFGHLFFNNIPGFDWLGRFKIPSSGDTYTVNRGTAVPSTSALPFRHAHGPSMRAIYDLNDLAASRFTLPGGESGHPASPHYDDLLTGWRDGQYFVAPTPQTAKHVLTLGP